MKSYILGSLFYFLTDSKFTPSTNIIILTLRVEKGIICLEKDIILGKEMYVDDFVRNVIPTVWDK